MHVGFGVFKSKTVFMYDLIIKSAPSSGKASLDPQNVTNIGNVGIECKYWLVLSIPLVLKVGMNIFKSKIYYLCYIL